MAFDPALRQMIAAFRKAPNWDVDLDLRLLQALWPKLVGAGLGESTEIEAIEGSRVVIRVDDRTWEKQLLSIRAKLLRKLNEPWPNAWITEIRFTYEDKRY
jgi:predicted nucleic acid-binding Zn ribbon protein